MRVILASVLLLVVVIAGCGSPTVNTSVQPTPTPTVTASPIAPTPTQVMTAYLAKAEPVRARYRRLVHQMDRIVATQAHSTADSTWAPVGRKIGSIAQKLYGVETRWALITPPKGLAAAHNAYGKSIEQNRKMYALESYCYVNQFDMSAYSMYGKQLTALLNRGNDEWETYRLALSVAAAKLGVKIPWKWDLA